MSSDEEKLGSSSIDFKQFDIVSDVSDHHYLYSNRSGKDRNSFTNGSVHRQIMKEWKILETDLPDSIYVRVFETRIDLLRAVIIGASGTPYHDGLFFFDICLPSDYPKSPPKVYYHSHGLCLNPNLYANGYVCLSLINTWRGNKPERWTPSQSTILQLLVSIQGLVLNEKPYFNEPILSGWPNKINQILAKQSKIYNESIFHLSWKTMLYKMQYPPKHFESFVTWHFQKRAKHILAAVQAYTNGFFVVGHYKEDGPSSLKPHPVSPQFKENMLYIYSSLKVAFSKLEKTAQMVGTSERPDNVPPAKDVATPSQPQSAVGKQETVATSSVVQPQSVVGKQANIVVGKQAKKAIGIAQSGVGKPKGSKQKGVWKKFISWFSKDSGFAFV